MSSMKNGRPYANKKIVEATNMKWYVELLLTKRFILSISPVILSSDIMLLIAT